MNVEPVGLDLPSCPLCSAPSQGHPPGQGAGHQPRRGATSLLHVSNTEVRGGSHFQQVHPELSFNQEEFLFGKQVCSRGGHAVGGNRLYTSISLVPAAISADTA